MRTVPAQLAEILDEIDAVNNRVRRLSIVQDDLQFKTRRREGSWSIAECLTHLNLTTEAFLPVIDQAFQKDVTPKVTGDHGYRKDLMGRLMCWIMEPPVRLRLKTTPSFQPVGSKTKNAVIEDFMSLQSELAVRIERGSDRDLNGIRVVSPFDARANYNLYSAFKLILA